MSWMISSLWLVSYMSILSGAGLILMQKPHSIWDILGTGAMLLGWLLLHIILSEIKTPKNEEVNK